METIVIQTLSGQAWARDAEGNLRELRPGDLVQPDETLVTDADANVTATSLEGESIDILPGTDLTPEQRASLGQQGSAEQAEEGTEADSTETGTEDDNDETPTPDELTETEAEGAEEAETLLEEQAP